VSTDKTYTEAVSEFGRQMAELRGEVTTGLTELRGAVNNLTTIVESGNAARVAEHAEVRKDVDDHEHRIRALEARRTITPRELWGVVSGVAGLAIAAFALIF
jgi:hypothetical protein